MLSFRLRAHTATKIDCTSPEPLAHAGLTQSVEVMPIKPALGSNYIDLLWQPSRNSSHSISAVSYRQPFLNAENPRSWCSQFPHENSLMPTPPRTLEDIVEALRPKPGTTRNVRAIRCLAVRSARGFPLQVPGQHIRTGYPAAYARATPKDYPGCMAALDRGGRRDLIGGYIDRTRKSIWADLALAQLIDHDFVDRVLTTNFDPLVSRACSLINSFPAVYDFAASHLLIPTR